MKVRELRPFTPGPELDPLPRVEVLHYPNNGELTHGLSLPYSEATVYLSNDEARALGLHLLGVTRTRPGTIYPSPPISRLSTDGKTVRIP